MDVQKRMFNSFANVQILLSPSLSYGTNAFIYVLYDDFDQNDAVALLGDANYNVDKIFGCALCSKGPLVYDHVIHDVNQLIHSANHRHILCA